MIKKFLPVIVLAILSANSSFADFITIADCVTHAKSDNAYLHMNFMLSEDGKGMMVIPQYNNGNENGDQFYSANAVDIKVSNNKVFIEIPESADKFHQLGFSSIRVNKLAGATSKQSGPDSTISCTYLRN